MGNGLAQLFAGLALCLILRRIKAGEVLTENFLAGITFHAGCSGIPAEYAAIRVNHVNREILDAIQQQTKPLFTDVQLRLNALAFADVSQNDGE